MTLEQLASLVDALLANLGDRNGFSLDEVEDAVLVDWKRGDLGRVIGSQDKFQIANIVSLLESANKDQGLRYFNLKTVTTADLPWVREVTAELMRAVEPHVRARPEQGIPNRAANS